MNWLGWITQKPITEDHVPLLPWLGVMWWGAAAGAWWLARQSVAEPKPLPRVGQALATLGRWSLSYYMLHQPLLIGVLTGVAWLGR